MLLKLILCRVSKSLIQNQNETTVLVIHISIPEIITHENDLLLMIEFPCAIVKNSHDVRIVMFVVVIERIKENSQSIPAVWRTEYVTIVITFRWCVPQCQSISSNSSTAGYTENYFNFPIIEIYRRFRPNGTFLTPKWWSNSDTLRTSDGICWFNGKSHFSKISDGQQLSNVSKKLFKFNIKSSPSIYLFSTCYGKCQWEKHINIHTRFVIWRVVWFKYTYFHRIPKTVLNHLVVPDMEV